jgi:hypothetical protein
MKKKNSTKEKRPFFKRRGTKILMITVGVLIIVRIILPYVVLHFANKTLSNMPGYFGHIKDIDLAVYRGAYKIHNIYLHKVDTLSMEETEFFESRTIDLSVHWGALLEGKIVGELTLDSPRLRFTKDKVEPKQVAEDTTSFRMVLDKFMPLRINRFEIHEGVIQYIDSTSNPRVNVQLDNTSVIAENLTTEKSSETLPSSVEASANLYGGKLSLHMRLDPLREEPTFDLNTELTDTHLPELNDFFQAYAKIDVNKGTFGLFSEVAAKDGKFIGYVKPLIKELDVLGKEDRDDNLLRKIWEGLAGGIGEVFSNQKHDQVATKLELKGSFKNTKLDIWNAILEILRNAFIQALQPSIDQEISLATVETVDESDAGKKKEKDSDGKGDTENADEPKEEKKGFLKKLFNKDKSKKDSTYKKKAD